MPAPALRGTGVSLPRSRLGRVGLQAFRGLLPPRAAVAPLLAGALAGTRRKGLLCRPSCALLRGAAKPTVQ
eukprot:14956629-Alexandrium_andersonii.AAC.1